MKRAYALPASILDNRPIILTQSAVQASLTGATTETTLATITIPGGMMGPNGSLRISTLWSFTNTANNKTIKIKNGSNTFLNYTLASGVSSMSALTSMRNRGTLNSQVAPSSAQVDYGTMGSNPQTFTIDTTVDQVLTITGQLANATDYCNLEAYTVEVLPG